MAESGRTWDDENSERMQERASVGGRGEGEEGEGNKLEGKKKEEGKVEVEVNYWR